MPEYKEFSRDFFDLVIVDECHRGSAAEDSNWRKILEYFSSATQIGLTATPKETQDVSNIDYFGEPVFTYSLKQGIADGFLAPYKVIRIDLDKDIHGWRPKPGQLDKYGHLIEDRLYNQLDMDRSLFADPDFDGEPVRIYDPDPDDPPKPPGEGGEIPVDPPQHGPGRAVLRAVCGRL